MSGFATLSARWRAFRSLRLNYTRRGVWVWLRGTHRGARMKGWRLLWEQPERVEQEQHALADGAFS